MKLPAPLFITRHVLFALVAGGIGGVVFMFFLLEFDHYTSSTEFCTTCHSMSYAETAYRESRHYNPASGVRAGCGDCHVSEGVIMATYDHAVGTKDLIKQFFGADYDNPVVNLLHLPEAAFSAREWFRKRDSATCRRCHVQEAISGSRTNTLDIHTEDAAGKTCIDCHINLVHRKVPEQTTFKREAWNAMVEEEFDLPPGTAARVLAGEPPPDADRAADGAPGTGQPPATAPDASPAPAQAPAQAPVQAPDQLPAQATEPAPTQRLSTASGSP